MSKNATLLMLYAAALQGLCANPDNSEIQRDVLATDALAIAKAALAALHANKVSP